MALEIGTRSNHFVTLTIDHSTGMEKLNGRKYSEHQKLECPSCMIGKSQLNDYPDSTTRADLPLKKVYFDLISSRLFQLKDTVMQQYSQMIVQNTFGSMV